MTWSPQDKDTKSATDLKKGCEPKLGEFCMMFVFEIKTESKSEGLFNLNVCGFELLRGIISINYCLLNQPERLE